MHSILTLRIGRSYVEVKWRCSCIYEQRLIVFQAYDAVDLDPYGTPSTLLDSAVQAVVEGGMLMVTATDMAVLCGNNADSCWSKYGSFPLHRPYCHEQVDLYIYTPSPYLPSSLSLSHKMCCMRDLDCIQTALTTTNLYAGSAHPAGVPRVSCKPTQAVHQTHVIALHRFLHPSLRAGVYLSFNHQGALLDIRETVLDIAQSHHRSPTGTVVFLPSFRKQARS
jgi:hypothetical protein